MIHCGRERHDCESPAQSKVDADWVRDQESEARTSIGLDQDKVSFLLRGLCSAGHMYPCFMQQEPGSRITANSASALSNGKNLTDCMIEDVPSIQSNFALSQLSITNVISLLLSSVLQSIYTPFDAVQQNDTRLEVRIHAPRSNKLDDATHRIVIRVAIKVTDLLEFLASGVASNALDIHDTETRSIVRLVGKPVDDILVVVNGLLWGLVVAGVLGVSECGDVEDVGSGVVVGGNTGPVHLVKFVVKEQEALVVSCDPALMCVGGTSIGSPGDDLDIRLVRHIVDGEGVLVITEANLLVTILAIGSLVDDALGIMDITIRSNAAGGNGFSRV